MRRNWLALICVVLIIAISWTDNQYFNDVVGMADGKRKAFHILFLALVMGIGYLPFRNSVRWTRQLWLISYGLVFFLILATGAINAVFHLFGPGFMDEIFRIRVWFCGPLPFMVIFLLSKLKGMMGAESK